MKKVIDLSTYRKKDEFARNRTPLSQTHSQAHDFADRALKIKESLQRMNAVLAELKTLAEQEDDL